MCVSGAMDSVCVCVCVCVMFVRFPDLIPDSCKPYNHISKVYYGPWGGGGGAGGVGGRSAVIRSILINLIRVHRDVL